MSQNRNKLIELFIGNISNSVVHRILEKAIDEEIIRKHYDKEFSISLEVAKRYRKSINPVDAALPDEDAEYIKEKIIKNVRIFHPVFDWWQKANLFRMRKILSMLKNHLMRWNIAACRPSMMGGF